MKHWRRTVLYIGVGAALLFNVAVRTLRREAAKGYAIRAASNTCSCYPLGERIIHLHLSTRGALTIGSDTIPSEAVEHNKIASLLSEIYAPRAERVLYLSADPDVPFQRVAEIVAVSQNLAFPRQSARRMAGSLHRQGQRVRNVYWR